MLVKPPPIHQGNVRDSSHEKVVADGPTSRRVNRPLPEIRPRWTTPIVLSSTHSVISMRSTVRNGPILVTLSKVVPTPDEQWDVRVIDSASAIYSVWVRTSATVSQTTESGARIQTLILMSDTA